MKITEKPNTYRTTNKKLLDGRHDRLINVHCRDHVTRQKSKQRHRSLKLADFHNQSPLLTMVELKIQTDFQVNYAMQGHEIISDEIFLLRKWVEQMIPNLDRNANGQ